jgi:hypothetical protein
LANVAGDLDLAGERQHVREQAVLQQRLRIDFLVGGVGSAFSSRQQAVQDLLEHRNGGGTWRRWSW